MEVRRGVDNRIADCINTTQECQSKHGVRRGRSRKQRDNSKHTKQPRAALPKFLQLGVAVSEGGGRVRKKKVGAEVQMGGEKDEIDDSSGGSISVEEESSNSCVPNSMPGIVLEVVLPGLINPSNSGLPMPQDSLPEVGRVGQRETTDLGSLKLLEIQKKVGFCYENPIEEVVKVLDDDEQRDRLKKLQWEQNQGF
jgi:hypothetical protein